MEGYSDNLDRDGFRPNVGIVLHNDRGQVFWGRRVGGFDAWQFPQGGIERGESIEQALYRELHEEVGLNEPDVEIRCRTRGWLRYRTPEGLRRRSSAPGFQGQKQKWFLLRLLVDDSAVCTLRADKPEFDEWRWVSYWYPVGQVIAFKRGVYRRALRELAPSLTVATGNGEPCSTR
ncbi:MAG: RNA pyrophosphohydrolase [Gammaproteobacteria bacterium]|nr:RNA pyrophosphohydrolase [Gammaproteobacteria bacterium]